jgi:predicted TIM-barrel fold metal-dependent hydrolase
MQKFKVFHPNPKTPNPLPPPKSCDSQVHIFAPADRYPVRPTAAYHTPTATISAALKLHKTLGFERGLIVQSTAYGTDYRILVDAIAEAGPNYRGCAVIDDTVTDADLRKMHDGGIRGARFNFLKILNIVPKPEEFRRSIERVQELGWFVKIHGTMQDLFDIEDLIKPLKLNAVIDHFGNPDFTQPISQKGVGYIQDLLKRGNWWMMLSNGDRQSKAGYPWNDAVEFARAYIEVAPDRMLWGTDWPHPLVTEDMPMKDDGELVELLYRMAPSEAILKKILVDNPEALFGFDR